MPLGQGMGQMHRTAPDNKEQSGFYSQCQNNHSAKVQQLCNRVLSESLTLKCKNLQNTAQLPFQTKFLLPYKCSIDQAKTTYS